MNNSAIVADELRAAEVDTALRSLVRALHGASPKALLDLVDACRKAAASAGVGFVHTSTVTTPREGSESQ